MKAAARITPRAWMKTPGAGRIMAALDAGATAPRALFVGGCVRNALLRRAVADVDIATVHRPSDVMALLGQKGIRVLPTGIDHGTVTAFIDGIHYEITTLRRDVATDGRRAVVAFSDDWAEDAQRRDFTINTLLADTRGRVFDPTGQGLADLRARRVRFVGAPGRRIAEDYLRILRFFRFHALYGRGRPDPAALHACRRARQGLARLSRERVTQELLKILAVDEPGDILGVMRDNAILFPLYAPGFSPDSLNRFCALQRRFTVVDISARLAAVTGMRPVSKKLNEFILLSNDQKKIIEALATAHQSLDRDLNRPLKFLLYKYKKEPLLQMLLWKQAQGKTARSLARIITAARAARVPVFPLSGKDIVALGVSPGPRVGQFLSKAEEWWLARDCVPGRAALLKQVRARV